MSILGPNIRSRHPDWLIPDIHFTFTPYGEVTHPSLSYLNRDSHLITDSYRNMAHFDLPPFTDPQALALHVLNPDVNTCSITAGANIRTHSCRVPGSVPETHLKNSKGTADWPRPTSPRDCPCGCCRKRKPQSSGHLTSAQSPSTARELFHFCSGSDSGRRVLPTSVASLCEDSEELKQDGGSSRGSGDGVGIVEPKATSRRVEHKEPFSTSRKTGSRLFLI